MAILRYIPVFIIIFFNIIPCAVFAQNEAKGNSSFEVYLYMEKYIFADNESMLLYINIKNKSGLKKPFKIYEADYTTFRPVVYDMNGKEADTLVEYRLKNKTLLEAIKDTSSRVIELSQNETFTHTIDLGNIYNIVSEKEYRVKSLFSPDVENQDIIVSYNQLTFKTIKAFNETAKSGISRISKFSSPVRELAPFEVVMLFLKAEKDRNWDNYFKYIDIEKFIKAYPDYVKIYNLASKKNDVEEKEKIIIEFVNFLKVERNDYIVNYEIQNELKRSEKNSYVEALVKRFAAGNPVYYKYRYSLERYENLWLITDVEVTVAKGRKI
jgi:hypothetical protein